MRPIIGNCSWGPGGRGCNPLPTLVSRSHSLGHSLKIRSRAAARPWVRGCRPPSHPRPQGLSGDRVKMPLWGRECPPSQRQFTENYLGNEVEAFPSRYNVFCHVNVD